tara:strand:- start:350 stop:769 length:420 start_codon:yes stop_codon:yes gene_type:complete
MDDVGKFETRDVNGCFFSPLCFPSCLGWGNTHAYSESKLLQHVWANHCAPKPDPALIPHMQPVWAKHRVRQSHPVSETACRFWFRTAASATASTARVSPDLNQPYCGAGNPPVRADASVLDPEKVTVLVTDPGGVWSGK